MCHNYTGAYNKDDENCRQKRWHSACSNKIDASHTSTFRNVSHTIHLSNKKHTTNICDMHYTASYMYTLYLFQFGIDEILFWQRKNVSASPSCSHPSYAVYVYECHRLFATPLHRINEAQFHIAHDEYESSTYGASGCEEAMERKTHWLNERTSVCERMYVWM